MVHTDLSLSVSGNRLAPEIMPFAEKLANRGQLDEEQRQAEARKAALKRQQAKAQKKKEQVKNASPRVQTPVM